MNIRIQRKYVHSYVKNHFKLLPENLPLPLSESPPVYNMITFGKYSGCGKQLNQLILFMFICNRCS